MALGEPGEYERMIWSLLGWLARYGHQPVTQLLEFSLRDLSKLARQIGEFMEEENRKIEE